ncbi:DUF5590 domain-containing protein [Bacillus sp. MRMR6]|uniref:cell wall elongation regulator TseB-like domain-containing protein n=1 Tax=Bacillus sp. MRMR6 TaxID=1928617 RepID=UPI000951088A|nr:DUF5590 domain-containing protein [Bacillus sp. MRMR6]OLS40266.1 peptidase [Bacillus sp. MRMR6]
MKKLIVIFIIFILLLIGLFTKVYLSAVEPVKQAEQRAIRLADKEVNLSKVLDFHIYNGLEVINIIEGIDENGEEIIVWIPEKSEKVITEKAKNGLSESEAVQRLMEEKKPKKVISVRLGMENEIPLWEIYYRSENNLINYYYVHFKTGEWLKKIENL